MTERDRKAPIRRRIAQVVILVIVVLTTSPLFGSFQLWPFVRYDMFSRPYTMRSLWLPVGVDPQGKEFSMNRDEYLLPFRQGFIAIMLRMVAKSDPSLRNLHESAQSLAQHYIKRRAVGHTAEWPELSAIRIYEVTEYGLSSDYNDQKARRLAIEVKAR